QMASVDVERFEQFVVDEGLPADLTSTLQRLGVGAATMTAINGLVIPQSIRAMNGAFPDLLARPADLATLTAAPQALQPLPGPAGGMAIQFAAPNYSVTETAGAVTVTVSRSSAFGPVTVRYATSNGTATAGKDYTVTAGTLSFADGQSTQTF